MTDDGRKGGDVRTNGDGNGGGGSGGGGNGGRDGGRNGDERLLEELGRLAREEREDATARLDGRWDALAAGELDDGEAARLRAEATEAAPAEAEAAWEAFRPFDADVRRRLLATARGQLAAETRGTEERVEPEKRSGGKVIRGPRRWWLPPAILAAAAALVLLLRPAPAPAPLPGYGLELAGSVQEMRSETPADAPREAPGEAPRHLFAPGNRLRLVLTPEVAVEGPVAARFFLVHDGGTSTLRAPDAAVSEAGAVLLEGVVGGEVRLPEGDSELLVAVGRPGALPEAGELRRRLASEASPGSQDWTAWKVPVRVEGGG